MREATDSSHRVGPTDTDLLEHPIGDAFDKAVSRFGDREALIVGDQDICLTYRELGDRVDAFAAGLIALNLDRGERVGIWAPNCWEWTVAQFATAKAGLVLVNINPAYRLSELEFALNKVDCRALILAERFKSSDYVAMINEVAPELNSSFPGELRAERVPHLRWVVSLGERAAPGMITFADVARRGAQSDRERLQALRGSLDHLEPINIQFTSGTTGSPKGATLSHRNILNNGYLVGEAIRLTEQDRVCIPVPLYHCFGMVMGNLACVTHGSTMVYPSAGFEPAAVLKTVSQERCTALYGVPTMFVGVLSHPSYKDFDLSSLRTGIMAGSPCPVAVMNQVMSDMHMDEVTIAYGMTETSPVSTQTGVADPVEKRVGTVGRVHPHVEVKIVDADGKIVPPGVKGEFCTRGYSVMRGYWNDESRTSESIDEDGWMHTGDLATMDDDGFFSIVGRLKDMVIRGGENVYPREIEEFLYTHPSIKDVSVFGVPDDKFGEEICAWVQVKDGNSLTDSDIRDFCKGQIAHFKIPRYVEFVDDFPMTVTGKIQKFVMRDKMMDCLGIDA